MPRPLRALATVSIFWLALMAAISVFSPASAVAAPLRVVLVPADGGTEDGTRADFAPLFAAVGRSAGITFELRVSQSYAAAVEALCAGSADVAFLGPLTYMQARERGCAELLAVAVEDGRSTYYSGIFVRAASPVRTIADLKGRSVALGDMNSLSSFAAPLSMLLAHGLDPARDLGRVYLAGSHAQSVAALAQGQVDAAALSFESFDRAVRRGVIDPRAVRVIARSAPLPNPPLALGAHVPSATKARLRAAFAEAARAPGLRPDMIRGYGGERVDGYDVSFPETRFSAASMQIAALSDSHKAAVLRKAGAAARPSRP